MPSAGDPAELHEVGVVGEPADDVQVVLDDADRAPWLAHRLDQVEHRVDPLGVDADAGSSSSSTSASVASTRASDTSFDWP